jgi:hypothetical protein
VACNEDARHVEIDLHAKERALMLRRESAQNWALAAERPDSLWLP